MTVTVTVSVCVCVCVCVCVYTSLTVSDRRSDRQTDWLRQSDWLAPSHVAGPLNGHDNEDLLSFSCHRIVGRFMLFSVALTTHHLTALQRCDCYYYYYYYY